MAESGRKGDPKFTRAAIALLPFATEFARRGGDVAAVLHRNRIPTDVLSNPAMLVEANACYSAMEDMANRLGDPHFGARLAIRAGKTGTPAIQEAAASSLTFGDFLARFIVEIARQVDNVDHRVEVSSQTASFELRRRFTPRGPVFQVTAVNVTFFVTLFQCGLGKVFDPMRITVLAPAIDGIPEDFLPKRSLLKSQLNGVRISFPPEWLWAPFHLGWKPDTAPRREMGDEENGPALSHFRTVMEQNVGQANLPLRRFAQLVGLHPRRVQRILAASRTSFRALKEDVRKTVALKLLADQSRSIADIAHSIGFSDPSAFDRAFREWTGTTPSSVRNKAAPVSGSQD